MVEKQQLAFSLVVRDKVVLVVVCGSVSDGEPFDRTGGVVSTTGLLMVMVTGVEVARLPAISLAVARRVCEPLATPMVFQEPEYGAVVRVLKILPSNLKETCSTPEVV